MRSCALSSETLTWQRRASSHGKINALDAQLFLFILLLPRESANFCAVDQIAARCHMLNQLTISQLTGKLAARETSAQAALQACLDRIGAVDGDIRAFLSYDPEDALSQ